MCVCVCVCVCDGFRFCDSVSFGGEGMSRQMMGMENEEPIKDTRKDGS